jgi:hypothetical protein
VDQNRENRLNKGGFVEEGKMKKEARRAMAHHHNQLVSVLLEIRGEEAQGALRLPVSIQHARNGQITLRLSHPLPEFMQDSLVNLPASLYLAFAGDKEIVESPGTVAWMKGLGGGPFQTLALDLRQLSPKLQHFLSAQVARPPADIKELWERWDEVQDGAKLRQPLNYHLGLILMVGGAVLNLAGTNSWIPMSYLLMLLGGLVAGVKNVLPLRWRGAK